MKTTCASFRQAALLLLLLFLFALLIANSALAMDGVRRGLSLCLETLFPSLFPFLVLSELFVTTGVGESIGRLFSRPVSALFGISGEGASALLLGAVCGSPTGAVTAAALCERGEIEKKEFDRLLLFCHNPSSGFLIGAVGEALFGHHQAGVALFFITLCSCALIGLFLRIVLGRVDTFAKRPHNGERKSLSPAHVIHSVKHAFSSLLQICAFVLFFSCLSLCITRLLEGLKAPSLFGVFLTGLLEMTSGISAAVSTLSPDTAFCVTAFFAGFSGISICLQIFALTEGLSPRVLPILLARLTQGGISLLLARGYLLLFKPRFSLNNSINTLAVRRPQTLFLFLSLLLVFGCLTTQRKRKGARSAFKKSDPHS